MRRIRVAGLLGVLAAGAAAFGFQSAAPSSSTASSPAKAPSVPRAEDRGPRPAAPDAAPVLGDEMPGVANLDPALRDALRQAAAAAAVDGLALVVKSGWRSPEEQEQMLREAVARYGSEEEAARWVASPAKSAHVSGDAIDVGPAEAAAWLSQRGAAYGLCQIYANEPWHFELRPDASVQGCPALYPDPTYDPRMQP